MNVASLELCKELESISGWDNDYFQSYYYCWNNSEKKHTDICIMSEAEWSEATGVGKEIAPAYDLGYLLRKLPASIEVEGEIYRLRGGRNQYYFYQYESRHDPTILWWNISPFSKDAPEDAAARLAIQLFKKGILTKEENDRV